MAHEGAIRANVTKPLALMMRYSSHLNLEVRIHSNIEHVRLLVRKPAAIKAPIYVVIDGAW
ncbi:MAG: hypothetical protein A2Z37_17135 [Chloroflexi bacterium RBG_19FT_COMBO_62_14]|nr:MAG: hypothetical protein A2Z37_17135 [Chloroflexi bacterium RBG_19FT_COMBO_62_14]